MDANGNDFIFIDKSKNPDLVKTTFEQLVRKICHRRFGAGADGAVTVESIDDSIFFRYFNRDGSEAGICGNALRCFARYVAEEGYSTGDDILIHTQVGVKKARIVSRGKWLVEIHIGSPVKTGIWGVELEGFKVYSVDVGVPHAVSLVDNLDIDVEEIGRRIRYNPVFPEGSNVNFAMKKNGNTIVVRTYERGVERETLSCGTGAVAVAYVAKEAGVIDKDIKDILIETAGGALHVLEGIDGYYIRGEARRVYDAYLNLSELTTV
jgi:diaminopimelate epimerase